MTSLQWPVTLRDELRCIYQQAKLSSESLRKLLVIPNWTTGSKFIKSDEFCWFPANRGMSSGLYNGNRLLWEWAQGYFETAGFIFFMFLDHLDPIIRFGHPKCCHGPNMAIAAALTMGVMNSWHMAGWFWHILAITCITSESHSFALLDILTWGVP